MKPLVAAEFEKLRSTGAVVRLVAFSLVAVLAVTLLSVSKGIADADPVSPTGADYTVKTDADTGPDTRDDKIRNALTQWTALGLVALVMGIFSLAGEVQTGTATSTFLAAPRRGDVLAAKALAALLVLVPTSLAAAALDTAIVFLGVDGPLNLSVLQLVGLAAGGTLMIALSLIAGLGLGAIVRRPAWAIVSAVVVIAVAEPALVPRIGDEAAGYLPTAALAAIVQASPTTGFATGKLLSPAAGVVVGLGYAAVLMVLGTRALRRTDI